MQRKEQEVGITEAQPKQGSSERGETMSNTDQKYADRTKQARRLYVLPSIIGTHGSRIKLRLHRF